MVSDLNYVSTLWPVTLLQKLFHLEQKRGTISRHFRNKQLYGNSLRETNIFEYITCDQPCDGARETMALGDIQR